MNRDIDTRVREISPVSDEDAGRLAGDKEALAQAIMATPSRGSTRAGWLRYRPFALPLTTAVTGAAVLAALAVLPGNGQQNPGTAASPTTSPTVVMQGALSVTEKDGYLTVVIRDPDADPKRYRKEFAKLDLDVDLRLAPVTPALVGQVLFVEGGPSKKDSRDIEIVPRPGCKLPSYINAGSDSCSAGFRVPTDYQNPITVAIGRKARPGEEIVGGSPADEGQPMHGIPYRGRKVSAVLDDLKKKRGVTVTEFRYESPTGQDEPYPNGVPPNKVEGDWYVHDALFGDDNEIILFVGPERN